GLRRVLVEVQEEAKDLAHRPRDRHGSVHASHQLPHIITLWTVQNCGGENGPGTPAASKAGRRRSWMNPSASSRDFQSSMTRKPQFGPGPATCRMLPTGCSR